jgi:hypothetical protein
MIVSLGVIGKGPGTFVARPSYGASVVVNNCDCLFQRRHFVVNDGGKKIVCLREDRDLRVNSERRGGQMSSM